MFMFEGHKDKAVAEKEILQFLNSVNVDKKNIAKDNKSELINIFLRMYKKNIILLEPN